MFQLGDCYLNAIRGPSKEGEIIQCMSERYRGRWVDPRAYELADGTGWTAEVYVAEDIGRDTVDTQFFLKGAFPRREAALAAAIAAGKRAVDQRLG